MKTEEFEMWASDFGLNLLKSGCDVAFESHPSDYRKHKIRIIIEKPERVGTITESQFDKLAYKYCDFEDKRELEKEIFGEDE